jgi:hypothetical protein
MIEEAWFWPWLTLKEGHVSKKVANTVLNGSSSKKLDCPSEKCVDESLP